MSVNDLGGTTALTSLLVMADADSLPPERPSVGACLGLGPVQGGFGQLQPQLRITSKGDELLCRLLVQCGHYILGPQGQQPAAGQNIPPNGRVYWGRGCIGTYLVRDGTHRYTSRRWRTTTTSTDLVESSSS